MLVDTLWPFLYLWHRRILNDLRSPDLQDPRETAET